MLFDDSKIKITKKDGEPVTGDERTEAIKELYQRQVQDRVLAQKGETDLGQGEYEQAPTYYSAAARFIDDAKQEKASPDQWRGMLKNCVTGCSSPKKSNGLGLTMIG